MSRKFINSVWNQQSLLVPHFVWQQNFQRTSQLPSSLLLSIYVLPVILSGWTKILHAFFDQSYQTYFAFATGFHAEASGRGHRTWYTIQLSVENRMSNIGNIYYINEIQDSVEIIIMAQWQSITQILTRSSCGSVIKANGISQSKPGLRVVQTKLLPFTCKFRLYTQAHLSLHNEGDHHVKGLNYTAFNVIRVSWYCQTTELQYITSQWISEFQLSSRNTHSAPSLSKNNKQHRLTVASCRVLCSQDQQRTPVSCDWWGPSSHEGNYSIHAHLINFNITFHINLNQFSALTLLVGRQEGHPACKKTGCWWWRFDWSFARLIAQVVQLSPLPPSSFASINTG